MDASRFGKRCLSAAVEETAAVLYPACIADWISLLALMEFAGEDLISLAFSKNWEAVRFASPRSDLLRHHSRINLRNLSAMLLAVHRTFHAAWVA